MKTMNKLKNKKNRNRNTSLLKNYTPRKDITKKMMMKKKNQIIKKTSTN